MIVHQHQCRSNADMSKALSDLIGNNCIQVYDPLMSRERITICRKRTAALSIGRRIIGIEMEYAHVGKGRTAKSAVSACALILFLY